MRLKGYNKWVGLAVVSAGLFLTSCSEESSRSTGLVYNSSEYGGYENVDFVEQETPPGMVFVEGGSFVMGRVEKDLNYEWNNIPRKVSTSSFYIDETEVTNQFYTEYLYWLKKVYGNEEQIFVYKKHYRILWFGDKSWATWKTMWRTTCVTLPIKTTLWLV